MCFFSKKLNGVDVFVLFGKTVPNMDVAGCASKTHLGIWKIGHTEYDKPLAIYTMNSTYKKWALSFEYKFKKDLQYVTVELTVKNLLLSESNNEENALKKEIKKKFPKLNFFFLEKETKIYTAGRCCKTLDDVKAVLEDFRSVWNESGFLDFIDENFQPSEESKDK